MAGTLHCLEMNHHSDTLSLYHVNVDSAIYKSKLFLLTQFHIVLISIGIQ